MGCFWTFSDDIIFTANPQSSYVLGIFVLSYIILHSSMQLMFSTFTFVTIREEYYYLKFIASVCVQINVRLVSYMYYTLYSCVGVILAITNVFSWLRQMLVCVCVCVCMCCWAYQCCLLPYACLYVCLRCSLLFRSQVI